MKEWKPMTTQVWKHVEDVRVNFILLNLWHEENKSISHRTDNYVSSITQDRFDFFFFYCFI